MNLTYKDILMLLTMHKQYISPSKIDAFTTMHSGQCLTVLSTTRGPKCFIFICTTSLLSNIKHH